MKGERWQAVQDLFHSALGVPDAERRRYLEDSCGDDQWLRREVDALLDAHESTGFMETPCDDSVAALLGGRHEELLGKRIAGYTFQRLIGQGGMGAVYAAEQQRPNRTVAVKLMRPGLAAPIALRRFVDEAEILGRLHHPNVAQVYEAGTFDEGAGSTPYFVMEFVPEARSITTYAEDYHLDTRARLELLLQACRAVEYGHQRGVIHRDLKPGNLLVDTSGQVKVIDFGVARATDSDIAMTTRSNIGEIIGTLAYMSPEQCEADPHAIDVRSDVYSVGAVLYELLAGRIPIDIEDQSVPQALRRIADVDPVPLGTIDRSLRGDLETIVHTALEKDVERRYPSMAAFAGDIERYLNHEPIAARPPSALYRARKFARRHTGLVVVAGIASALLLAATIVSLAFAVASGRAERDAEEARTRAQARFDASWQVAHTLMFDLHESIKDLDGATEARHLLIDTARGYLAELAEQIEDEPQLERELAEAYLKLGDVEGGFAQANLGDSRMAQESYRAAIEILEGLEAGGSGDDEIEALHGDLDVRLGDLLRKTGETGLATEHYRRAIDRRAAIVERSAGAPNPLRDLAVARSRLGGHLGDSGETTAGLDELDRARALFDKLVKQMDGHPLARRDAGVIRNRQASALARLGRTADAIEHRREALAIYEPLCAEFADNASYRRSLARTHQVLGSLLTFGGDPPTGRQHYRAALDIRQATFDADPRNALARRDLAAALASMGDVTGNPNYPNDGDHAATLAYYERSIELRRHLVDADPDNVSDQRGLAIMHTKVGDVLLAQGRLEDASNAYDVAVARVDAALAERPADPRLRAARVVALQRVGDGLRESGEAGRAIPHYRDALDEARGLSDADPSDVAARRDVTTVLGKLAYALELTGGFEEALALNLEALSTREEISAADSASEQDSRNVAVSCDNLGRLAAIRSEADTTPDDERRDLMEEAVRWYRRSVAVFDELEASGRGRASDESYVASIRAELARCETAAADWRP